MTSEQSSKPIVSSPFDSRKHGKSEATISELLPHTASVADELCIVRSMYTDAINHDPAMTLLQTGTQFSGHPSMGAWVSYGLGSETEELPTFVVMFSGGEPGDQPISARLWGSAFLAVRSIKVCALRPEKNRFCTCRIHLASIPATRRSMLDTYAAIESSDITTQQHDPETLARIAQFELAFRMQDAVPKLADFSDEPASTFELYGNDVGSRARMLRIVCWRAAWPKAECDSSSCFIAAGITTNGWSRRFKQKCEQTDRASAALVKDLQQRGLLDDTLIVLGRRIRPHRFPTRRSIG